MNLRDKTLPSPLRAASPYLRWSMISLALPLVVGVIAYKVFSPDIKTATIATESSAIASTQAIIQPSAVTALEKPSDSTIEYIVKRNDTLEHVFREYNISLNDLAMIRILPDVRRVLDLLKPGDSISLSYIDGALQSLRRRLSNTELLTVTRNGTGTGFTSAIVSTPVDIKVTTVHGVVDSSLYAAAHDAGLSADVIMRMANDIFGWDIDFALDIRAGDEFTVSYEQQYRGNEYLGDGRILAAEFINDHHVYRAVHFNSTDGTISSYFTPEGRSMQKQFLRAPVDFTRISSGFSLARLHPILNTIRAHKGIDYAAPTGTPIKAAGDGKVEFMGVRGGYGNAIVLDHGAGITTLYGHLSKFASIHTGARVIQGQIIGYVGRTGAATGPHLHYEYHLNGVYKDPRTVALPDARPIPMSYLAEFHHQADELLAGLDRSIQANVHVAAPISVQARN